MGWFDGRIDIRFRMYCLHCKAYSFYPYCDEWTFGKSPEQVFDTIQHKKECPNCGHKDWGHNF